ncbi:MAG: sigma-54-dependent Fis family transcriptional regulator [bacterium]|nr:sigma-54-dependent Fis family transcriptional regulator [bacterium]MCP5070986.1 sigma-54-dependent Fis family transcriptional regulator [bacterium]
MTSMTRIHGAEADRTIIGNEDQVVQSEVAGRRREDRIVGSSEATRRLIAQATAAARSDLPVWLIGPAGSDKDLVARAIHTWSARAPREIEVLACSAVPDALQARELFGCAAGVYPAVPGEYAGALERGAGNSLLLLDIEALREDVLKTLLRSLQTRSFRREGDNADRTLSARVIAAGDGSASLPTGDVGGHEIRIPGLAERHEDILPLAAHYLRAFSEEAGVTTVGFTADARACLETESFPGDVAELRERVRQAIALSSGGALSAEALMLAKDAEEVPSFKEAKRAFETRYVVGLLRRCRGNISRAARLAKKDRKDFYDVIRRTGVDPSEFRS